MVRKGPPPELRLLLLIVMLFPSPIHPATCVDNEMSALRVCVSLLGRYLRLFTAPANKWAWERWLAFGSAAKCFAAAFFSGSLWLLLDACFTKAL